MSSSHDGIFLVGGPLSGYRLPLQALPNRTIGCIGVLDPHRLSVHPNLVKIHNYRVHQSALVGFYIGWHAQRRKSLS